ncbi:unnamed protein product, partial [Rotaria magnacalcarata]
MDIRTASSAFRYSLII